MKGSSRPVVSTSFVFHTCQEIGWEDRLQNDLKYIQWDVKQQYVGTKVPVTVKPYCSLLNLSQ